MGEWRDRDSPEGQSLGWHLASGGRRRGRGRAQASGQARLRRHRAAALGAKSKRQPEACLPDQVHAGAGGYLPRIGPPRADPRVPFPFPGREESGARVMRGGKGVRGRSEGGGGSCMRHGPEERARRPFPD